MNKLFLSVIFILSAEAFAFSDGGSGPGVGHEWGVSTGGKIGGIIQTLSSKRQVNNSDRVTKAKLNQESSIVVPFEGCEEAMNCSAVKVDPAEHLKFGISFIKKVDPTQKLKAPKSCDCITDYVQGKLKLSDEAFAAAKKNERTSINNVILKSYGTKFVNQFAANLEDMAFFANQTPDMFSNNGKRVDLQCMYVDIYESKIKETCDKKNIKDQNFIEDRKDLFINVLRTDKSVIFKDRMPALASEVFDDFKSNNIEEKTATSSTDTASNSPKMARVQYDQLRMDTAIRNPKAKFIDSLISTILKDPGYSSEVSKALESGISFPYDAILGVISANASNLVVTDENREYVKDAAAIEDSLKFLMMLHPGVGLALFDKQAFKNVRNIVKPGSTETFVNTLNNSKNVLEPILDQRCNTMIEEFANAVCTSDEELIASVDPNELESLFHGDKEASVVPKTKEPELHDLLICESRVSGQKVADSKTFGGISGTVGNSIRDSDYIASAGKGGVSVGRTAIAQLTVAAANDSELRSQIGEAIDRNNRIRKSDSVPGIIANRAYAEQVLKGNVMSFGSSDMSKEEAKKIVADNKKWEATRSSEIAGNNSVQKPVSTQVASTDVSTQSTLPAQPQSSQAPQPNTFVPNYSNAQATNVAPSTSQAAAQSRDQLRQYLAQKNDPVETSKAVTALDDSSVQELNKLRTERQSLLEQQLKDGEARLKDLRSELSNTASKVKAPVADKNIASVDEDNSEFEPRSFGRNPTSIDQRSAIGGGSFGGGPVSSNAGAASTGGSKSGSVVSSNNVSKDASDTEAQVNASSKVQSVQTDSSGSIVITSSGVKSSESLPAQELNQEVQKFLAGTDLKAASIEDIKTKGIKIRFNVMENNKLVQKEMVVKYDNLDQETRNQIDLKFARNNVKNQVSKLAVLRMLIKQNKSL